MNQQDREHIHRHAEESLAEPRVYKPLLRIQALAANTLGLLAELGRVEAERDAAEAALAQERERAERLERTFRRIARDRFLAPSKRSRSADLAGSAAQPASEQP